MGSERIHRVLTRLKGIDPVGAIIACVVLAACIFWLVWILQVPHGDATEQPDPAQVISTSALDTGGLPLSPVTEDNSAAAQADELTDRELFDDQLYDPGYHNCAITKVVINDQRTLTNGKFTDSSTTMTINGTTGVDCIGSNKKSTLILADTHDYYVTVIKGSFKRHKHNGFSLTIHLDNRPLLSPDDFVVLAVTPEGKRAIARLGPNPTFDYSHDHLPGVNIVNPEHSELLTGSTRTP